MRLSWRVNGTHTLATCFSVLAAIAVFSGCAGHGSIPGGNTTASHAGKRAFTFTMRAGAIAPPSAGAYFGAWVYPSPEPTPLPTGLYEQETESLESAIGRPLRLHLHYFSFSTVFPDSNNTDGLADDYTHGRIPVISWGCSGTTLAKIGHDSATDAIISKEASTIAAYGHPVFIRWFWEMNINDTVSNNQWTNPTANGNTCMATSETNKSIQQVQIDNATNFIAAWRYIYSAFSGAANVTWLWNPDYTPIWYGASNFYPGDSYVDWVGDDEYDKCANGGTLCSTGNGFTATINPFYFATPPPPSKPLMVGETGSCQQYGAPYNQPQYFTDATNDIAPGSQQVFPNIAAFMYFDAAGQYLNGQCSWVIAPGAATQSFSAMGLNPYFGGITHGTILSKAAYASSVTLQPSSAYPSGDVLLAYVSVHEGPSPGITVTPPSNWKLLGRYDDYGNAAELVYEYVTGPNEPLSYTWSWGTTGGYGAMLVPYTGVNVSHPIDVSAGPSASSGQVSSETTQSLSPANGGEYEISFFSGYNPPQSNTGFTYSPSNWTNAASLAGQRANIVYLEYPLGLANGQFSTTINWTGSQSAFTTAWFNAALNPAF